MARYNVMQSQELVTLLENAEDVARLMADEELIWRLAGNNNARGRGSFRAEERVSVGIRSGWMNR